MSLIGKPIVEFSADAYYNGEFIKVSNDDLQGKWAIFCFYPADFSFVCPTELGDLQEQYAELQKLGVEVYSVSTDTHFVHKAWHDDSDVVGTITYAMIGDQKALRFLVKMVWHSAAHLSWILMVLFKPLKLMPMALDVMQVLF